MKRSLPNVPAVLAIVTVALVLFAAKATRGASSELSAPVAAPFVDAIATSAAEDTAVFAGGCFWGVEAVYEHVKGVKSAVSGYAGGNASNATYDQVSNGDTGHAESVQVIYDPSQVSYGKLLQIFFSVAHDPTQLNRQGPDRGTQYRSAIFYTVGGPAACGRELHQAAHGGEDFLASDRNTGREAAGLLSRRGVPPGLPGEPPESALYRDQRSAQGCGAEKAVRGHLQVDSETSGCPTA